MSRRATAISANARGVTGQEGDLEPQVVTVATPATLAQAIGQMHSAAHDTRKAVRELVRLAKLQDQNPEMRTIVINPGNNGQYQTLDQAPWAAKSIGVLNPGTAPVYIGTAMQSATALARVPSVPGNSALVLPISVADCYFGCDAGTLGGNTAVIFVFRYVSLQPLSLTSL